MHDGILTSRSRFHALPAVLGLCLTLVLPAVTWAITPCPTHNGLYPPAQQPGEEIFKGALATFAASGKESGVRNFYYKLSFDVRSDLRTASPGNSFVLVYGADAEGNGGSLFLSCTFQEFQTHYETDGTHCPQYASIPESAVSGSSVTITPLYGFASNVCRGPTFEVPAGVVRSSQADELCDGLDNDEDNQVDDVAGGCNAQPVPGMNDNECPSLNCAWHKVDRCISSPNGGPTPCAGGEFDARFGFEVRRLSLVEVSSPGIPLRIELVYNNRDEGASSLSGRWSTNFDVGLSVRVEGIYTVVIVRWPDGTRSRYATQSGTDFIGEFSDGSRVKQNYSTKTESWDLFYHDGLKYHFTASGLLESIHDGKGNNITLARENTAFPSLPTRVTDNYGHEILLSYGTSGQSLGKLASVTDPVGRAYDLGYQDFLLKTGTLPVPDPGKPRPSYELFYADLAGFDRGGYRDNLTKIQFHPDAADPDPQNDRVIGQWNYDHSSRVQSEEGPGGALAKSVSYSTPSTTVTDSRGNQTSYGFNFTSGLTLTTTVPCPSCGGGTASSTLVRNAQGKITSKTDFRGTQTTWAGHDSNGDPGTVTEAVGQPEQRTTAYTYHPTLFRRLSIVEPSALPGGTSKVTIFDYQKPSTSPPADPPANPPADLNPASFNIPGTNNANFDNVVHRVIESGWTRDIAGNAVRVAYVTHYVYDALGRITQIDGPRDNAGPAGPDVTTFAYYPDSSGQGTKQGQLHTVTNAALHVMTFNDYDAMGNVLSVTDPNGLVTVFTYDASSRVRTITQAGAGPTGENLVTEYVYEANGNLDYVKLPRGNFYNYQYDAANRLVSITRTATQPASPSDAPSGETIAYIHDTEGNRVREEVKTDVAGTVERFIDFEYDTLNRLARVYNPAFPVDAHNRVYTESTYDANGNRKGLDLYKVVTDVSTRLRHTAFDFDPLNRLSEMTQDGGVQGDITTGLFYDGQDNLQKMTDARSHDTTSTTDDFGRQVQVVSPDTGTTRYAYDPAGNPLEKSENGVLAQYAYDALNRLTQVSFPSDSSQNLAYVYDTRPDAPPLTNGLGRLVKILDSSGTTYFTYDTRGNRTLEARVQDGVTLTLTHAWDENGNLSSVTYPSGREIAYTYDPTDHPTLVSMTHQGNTTTLASSIAYEPFGPFTSLVFGNGLIETRAYDVAGQIETIHLAPSTGPALLDLAYTFDETESITAIADTLDATKNKTYGYDLLDRLTTAGIGGLGSFAYSYDSTGNRTQAIEPQGTTNYAIKTTNNQIDSLSGAQSGTFTYNAHGDTTSDGTKTFTYSLTHQLVQAAQGANTLGVYKYDGLSRRTAETVQGRKRFFLYGANVDPMGEYDDSGNLLKEYAYVGTLRLALVDHDQDDDAVRDEADNCLIEANADQADQDSDLLGDACDSAPANPDRDDDGLLDGQEDENHNGIVDLGETDPDNRDTDGDVFSDGAEVAAGSDPLDPNSTPQSVPTLGEAGAGVLILALLGAGGWATRKRWPRGTTHAGLVLLATGATFISPGTLKSQGGPAERILYIHTDHLGTPLLMTDANQQVVWRGAAEPFGKTTPSVNQVTFNLRFPGQYQDEETGLTHNNHRDYNTGTGRYQQPDPIGLAGGANPYEYVSGNPLTAVDPSGLLTAGIPNPLYATPLAAQAWYRNLVGPSTFNFWIPAGEGYGEYAAQYYAGVLGDPCASSWARGGAWAGGLLSSLWTWDTSDLTFLALSSAYGGAKAFGAAEEAGADVAYHYTFREAVASIEKNGLRPGSYATPNGNLSPLQVQIDLALPPNRGLTNAVLRVDLAGLRKAGYEIPKITRVGRAFNMPGGGFEVRFPYEVPPEYISGVSR